MSIKKQFAGQPEEPVIERLKRINCGIVKPIPILGILCATIIIANITPTQVVNANFYKLNQYESLTMNTSRDAVLNTSREFSSTRGAS